MSAQPWYATNARDLLDARRKGLAPAKPIVVTMIDGDFRSVAGLTLRLREDMPVERMDWRMLVNLETWLWADGSVPLERVLQALDGIARVRPRRLCLRFDYPYDFVAVSGREYHFDTHDVEVGDGFHIPAVAGLPALHEFHWLPITLNGTPIERRLRAAALSKHPRGTVL